MPNYKVIISVFLGFAMCTVAIIWFSKGKSTLPEIKSFEDCVKAGYKVMESYPRQCTTPKGKFFVEQAVSQESKNQCKADADCGTNFYCNRGQCAVFAVRTMCQTDNDCQLIDRNQNFSCCWAGRCETIDYSKDNWIAASNLWFSKQQEQICPTKDQCGPAPGCPTRIKNSNFIAKCINNACQKVQK
jgi:hypothetical protein